jgi:4-hydroxy-3-methylbut-2-enyl diphosphate reductase
MDYGKNALPIAWVRNNIWSQMDKGNKLQKVLLASPRGFCAGVVRAIDIVNLALEKYGQPLFVRREIVHNKYVVNELHNKGTIFVDELDEVPSGGRVIFSAHGVSPAVRAIAKARSLKVIDATCPLVTKVHNEAIRYARGDYTIILIGHADHDEVIGTTGEAPNAIMVVGSMGDVDRLEVADPGRVAYLTQTTLSLNDTCHIIERLRHKYPLIRGPVSADICYATQNRQSAVLELANKAKVILVVGSANSSNSRRLVEVAKSACVRAYLIDDITDIQLSWFTDIRIVGLTAGASAPEELVERVIHYLSDVGYPHIETIGSIVEDVEFALPPELSNESARSAIIQNQWDRL